MRFRPPSQQPIVGGLELLAASRLVLARRRVDAELADQREQLGGDIIEICQQMEVRARQRGHRPPPPHGVVPLGGVGLP